MLGNTRIAVLCIAPCAIGLACSAGSPRLVEPIGETHRDPSSTGGARPRGHDEPTATVSVVLGDQLRRACNLPDPPADAPRFDVEQARLRPLGDDPLTRVASCIDAGRLGGAKLWLIGHADRRGDADYNYRLGLYRATAAKQHLVDLGAPAARLAVESSGAGEARGTDEASWAPDHRIEVRLAPALQRSMHRREPRGSRGR
jgi:peptidoglycan-associated lipoprotein